MPDGARAGPGRCRLGRSDRGRPTRSTACLSAWPSLGLGPRPRWLTRWRACSIRTQKTPSLRSLLQCEWLLSTALSAKIQSARNRADPSDSVDLDFQRRERPSRRPAQARPSESRTKPRLGERRLRPRRPLLRASSRPRGRSGVSGGFDTHTLASSPRQATSRGRESPAPVNPLTTTPRRARVGKG